MVNPYDSPTTMRVSDQPAQAVPFWALSTFGVVPGAIIFANIFEAYFFPTRGWNAIDWFWAVGPPAYLVAAWMFALFIHGRNSRRLAASLAVFMIPLILFGLHICLRAADIYVFLSTGGLHRFGINQNFRLLAVLLPLWLAASVACAIYWCRVLQTLTRVTAFSSGLSTANQRMHGRPRRSRF
jgi:hypothetical protein